MPSEPRHRVLIVGCGELGARHLQAVGQVESVTAIDVVDPRSGALELGRKRLAEISSSLRVETRWLHAIEDASSGDLCIVPTQADVRGEVFRRAVALGYKRFLLEKIVAPSVREYEEMLALTRAHGLSVWVNCKSRAYSSYRRIRQSLAPGEPVTVSVVGGNHGLANNGVHFADLFVFLDGAEAIELIAADIDSVLHRSKRGDRIFDLSGRVVARSRKGSTFTMVLDGGHMALPVTSIVSARYRAVVDDSVKLFYESVADSPGMPWQWRQIPYDENLMVSHMTQAFAKDILDRGSCELPTLDQCFPAHRFILETLRPHFNRLLHVEAEACPVT